MDDQEQPLRDAMKRVMTFMDSLSPGNSPRATITDSPMVLFNGWNRWCVKFDTHSGKNYHAFGSTLIEALSNLVDQPIIFGEKV
jgi:hypothetical protein